MSPHPTPEQLGAYLDGELDPPARSALDAHLSGCGECGAHLADLASVDQAARDTPLVVPDRYFDDFAPRVRARLQKRAPARWRPPAWGWAAAAALLLAVVTPLALQERSSPVAIGRDETSAPAERAEQAPKRLEYGQGAPPADAPSLRAPATEAPVSTMAAPPKAGARETPPAFVLADRAQKSARRDGERYEERPQAAADAGLDSGHLEGAPAPDAQPAAPPAAAEPARGRANEQDELAKLAGTKKEDGDSRDARVGFAAPPTLQRQHEPRAQAPAPASPRAGGRLKAAAETKDKQQATAAAAEKEAAASGSGVVLQESVDVTTGTRDLAPGAASVKFRSLQASAPPRTDSEARLLREAWRTFAAENPDHPQADEARVRVIEAGALAYRLGRRPPDLQIVERDARAYLEREQAPQASRVKSALRGLEKGRP
jgi:anti-sigma factor RsiW